MEDTIQIQVPEGVPNKKAKALVEVALENRADKEKSENLQDLCKNLRDNVEVEE